MNRDSPSSSSTASSRPLFITEFVEGFVAAEHDGIVIGCGRLEIYGDCGVIRSVVVDENARNKRIGERIAELLIADARAAGATDLYLFTMHAARFWRRLGFQDAPIATWKQAAPHLLAIPVHRTAPGRRWRRPLHVASRVSHAPASARISVRVTPRAARDETTRGAGGALNVRVTAPPADGKANAAATRALAAVLRGRPVTHTARLWGFLPNETVRGRWHRPG